MHWLTWLVWRIIIINIPNSEQKISFHPLYVLSFAPAETLSPFPEIYETIKKSALASPQNAELMLVPRDWKTSQTTYYIHHVCEMGVHIINYLLSSQRNAGL